MTALSKDRNTPKRDGGFKADRVAASTRIFTGALLMRSAAGFVDALDGSGVWVRFGEAVTRGA